MLNLILGPVMWCAELMKLAFGTILNPTEQQKYPIEYGDNTSS